MDRSRPRWRSGRTRSVPAVDGVQARGQLAEARARRLPRAGVEVRARRGRPRRGRRLPSAATAAASWIWATDRRNFAATSRTSSEPLICRHACHALLQGRHRRLEHDRGPVPERERRPARGGDHERAVRRAGRARGRGGARSAGSSASRPSKHSTRSSSAADQLRLRHQVAVGEVAAPTPAAAAGPRRRRRSRRRPGRRRPRASAGARPAARRAGPRPRRDPGHRPLKATARRRGSPSARCSARAEQDAGEPVGDAHGALGERDRRVAVVEAQRAARAQRRVGGEAAQDVGAGHARRLEQLGHEPRRGVLAGDVVLQVGEQAAVARVELRRRAQPEHRGVERVEPEPGGHRRQAALDALVGDAAGEGQRQLVGDVEAAERVRRVRVQAGDLLHRGRRCGRRARPKETDWSAAEAMRDVVGFALHRVAGLGHRQRAARSARRAAARRGSARGRAGCRRRWCPASTRPRRSRRRCRW